MILEKNLKNSENKIGIACVKCRKSNVPYTVSLDSQIYCNECFPSALETEPEKLIKRKIKDESEKKLMEKEMDYIKCENCHMPVDTEIYQGERFCSNCIRKALNIIQDGNKSNWVKFKLCKGQKHFAYIDLSKCSIYMVEDYLSESEPNRNFCTLYFHNESKESQSIFVEESVEDVIKKTGLL